MIKEFKVKGIDSSREKIAIETEIGILRGVSEIVADPGTGEVRVEIEENKISSSEILKELERLGFSPESNKQQPVHERAYFVSGMHCASCEVLIEKKLLALKGVKSVEASATKGEVILELTGETPSLSALNGLFAQENYRFREEKEKKATQEAEENWTKDLPLILLIVAGFLMITRSNFSNFLNLSSASFLPLFFAFGLLAGVSTCGALVGGIILSMAKQWYEKYEGASSFFGKAYPHLLFNAGRIISFGIFGAALGMLGERLTVSPVFTATLVIAASILMVILGLQMLGFSALAKFQPTLPRSLTRLLADEKYFRGRYMPFLMGAGTFLLPCGFTVTAQSLALLSGNALRGGLIMGLFAAGTAFPLMGIGLASVKLFQDHRLALRFSRVAGALVLFFALFNFNNQLNVLGVASLNDLTRGKQEANVAVAEDGLPPIINGKQIIKMSASASGYSPNYFKIRAGTPVRWEITDTGTSGCTNAVISNGLFSGQIDLTPGTTSVKEFTPGKLGKYKFSCWMGMISGIMEVVDGEKKNSAVVPVVNAQTPEPAIVPSGVNSCGGGSCGCGKR